MEHLTAPTLHPPGSQRVHGPKWDLKVSTNLQTRLLLVLDPHSTIRSLQDAIEEDHLAIYPSQGPVKCSTVCAVDYNAAGAERYYPINSKYLLQDALKRDGAEVFAYVELKQVGSREKKRKRSLGSHAALDLFSGASGQEKPRAAAAAASSPSPLPQPQPEAGVCSGSSGSAEGVEGDTDTAMLRKAARVRHRKKKLKEKRAAATTQKAVMQGAGGAEQSSGSREMPHPPQPERRATKAGAPEYNEETRELYGEEDDRGTSRAVAAATPAKAAAKNSRAKGLLELEEEVPAGKFGKRKRGPAEAAAAVAEGVGARQVPQEADGDLADEGHGPTSRQLQPAAADAAEPAQAHSPEQSRRKRRKKNRHGSGAEDLLLESKYDGDAPQQTQEAAPQPSSAPGAVAAVQPIDGCHSGKLELLKTQMEEVEGQRRTRAAGQRSSGASGRPAAKDSLQPILTGRVLDACNLPKAWHELMKYMFKPIIMPDPISASCLHLSYTASEASELIASGSTAGTAVKAARESSSEKGGDNEAEAGAAPAAGQTNETASGARDEAAGKMTSSESSDSSSESESDSDEEGGPAHNTRSQQPWRRPLQMPPSDTPISGAAGSPSEGGPVQASALAGESIPAADGAGPQPSGACGEAPEKPATQSAGLQSPSSSEDDSSDESSSSSDEVGPGGGTLAGLHAPRQEALEQLLPTHDALQEADSEGESDLGFKEEADVKGEEESGDLKSESQAEAGLKQGAGLKQEAGMKQNGHPEGQDEASSADESSEEDASEEEDSEAEEQESEGDWGDEGSTGSDDSSNVTSLMAAEGRGGTSRNMAVEDSNFDRLKNEATQKVLDTLADMPDAISMLLAAKSARKKARQNGVAPADEPARQEAPSTPVPSDARLASLGDALIRQKESQEQLTQETPAAGSLPGHPELKPLAEYKVDSDLRSALRAALVPLVNHQQGTNHKYALQVLRECAKPEWWPLEKWDRNQLDRRWKALETIYHAIQKQRRILMGSASSA